MADAGQDELDALARELYILPSSTFTQERNQRASQATDQLAAKIKALRKPSVAAWAVNLLVNDGQLAEAVELSQALHEAQDELDAAELGALGKQRRALVAGLARRAADLAKEAGVALSSSVQDEVERTINAAIVDTTVAPAVLTGRLIRTVQSDDGDLADAVGGSLTGSTSHRPAGRTRDELAERRARKAAESAAREAARVAGDAERELHRVTSRLAKAEDRAKRLRARIAELSAELESLTTEVADADDETTALTQEHAEAAERSRAANAEAERAQAELTS